MKRELLVYIFFLDANFKRVQGHDTIDI